MTTYNKLNPMSKPILSNTHATYKTSLYTASSTFFLDFGIGVKVVTYMKNAGYWQPMAGYAIQLYPPKTRIMIFGP